MYESPIELFERKIVQDIEERIEGVIFKECVRVGVNVNKDELIKALQYDRGQYDCGYADGRAARDREIVRCKDCKWYEETDARIGTCLLVERGAEVNGFCAWGERKENDD